jgi:hypothetical protein
VRRNRSLKRSRTYKRNSVKSRYKRRSVRSRSKNSSRSTKKKSPKRISGKFGFYNKKDIDPMSMSNIIKQRKYIDIVHCISNVNIYFDFEFYYKNKTKDEIEQEITNILKEREQIWNVVLNAKRQLHNSSNSPVKVNLLSKLTKGLDKLKITKCNKHIDNHEHSLHYLMTSFPNLNGVEKFKLTPTTPTKQVCFYNNKDNNDNKMYLKDKFEFDKNHSKIDLDIYDLEKGKFGFIWINLEILLELLYSLYIERYGGDDKKKKFSSFTGVTRYKKDEKPHTSINCKSSTSHCEAMSGGSGGTVSSIPFF